ncbi:MAG: hypothetical protein RLY93_15855 [Sumerlaeia bacterium]
MTPPPAPGPYGPSSGAAASGRFLTSDDEFEMDEPDVIILFRIVCGLMALLCGIGLLGAAAIINNVGFAEGWLGALLLVLVSLALGPLYLAGVFPPRRSWMWYYGLVLMSISSLAVCPAVVTGPIIYYWLREDCRSWYGV